MNIDELFEKIEDKYLLENINGELTLHSNSIIWEYSLDDEEIETIEIESDELEFDFQSENTEELLLNAYNKDFELLQKILDELEEFDNWAFSDPEIIENSISFKIF